MTGVLRAVAGSRKCPRYIYKRSLKKYGDADNLSRYWLEKYRGIEVGKYTWGHWNIESDIIKSIGKFCSIAHNQNVAPNGHRMEYVTTWNTNIQYPNPPKMEHSTVIGNDVWIGANATIFNDVTIGDGAVIGTGAIIKEDVPPYAVVVGVGKIVKYRFPDEIIQKLLKMQWWNWEDKKIFESFKYLTDPIAFIDAYDV